jgi:transcriptional regulator
MYIPTHFAENNSDELCRLIRENPLAIVVANTAGGLSADHLPVYLNTENKDSVCLQGHIAKANSLWKSVDEASKVLVIFQGSNAYISPSWLPTKKVHGKVVPTWNYTAVHVKGKIKFIHESKWKMTLLHNLTDAQEKEFSKPWAVADAPSEFVEKMLLEIVGFEITISEIFGKFKLSQNQSAENRMGIAKGLKEQGHEMAELISEALVMSPSNHPSTGSG